MASLRNVMVFNKGKKKEVKGQNLFEMFAISRPFRIPSTRFLVLAWLFGKKSLFIRSQIVVFSLQHSTGLVYLLLFH